MAQHSTSRRWKGCNLCKSYRFKDDGQRNRQPFAVHRRIGNAHRVTRHDLGDWATKRSDGCRAPAARARRGHDGLYDDQCRRPVRREPCR